MTSASAISASSSRLSLPRLAAFATPGLSLGALAVALTVYLPRYYAGHLGLGLKAVGLIFMSVRLIDMFFDPLIGVAMDRTRTAAGRYRVWLVGGAPILMAGVFMLFDPPGAVSLPYLLGWLFVYYIGTSIIALSHASWASVVAAKYDERSRVFGVLQLVGILGACAVLVLPVAMSRHNGASGAGDVAAMGWFVIAAAPLGVLLAVLHTPERVVADLKHERFGLRDYWEMVSRPDMRRIIFADFCLALGPGWMSALYLFYFHEARGFTISVSSELLFIYIAAGVIGAAGPGPAGCAAGQASDHDVRQHRLFAGAGGPHPTSERGFLPAALLMFALGFAAAGFPLLDRAMVADVGDAVRLDQGKNRIALLYAMITTTQKVAGALSIGLSFVLLGLVGFDPREGAVNTPSAIHGLQLIYLIVPVVFVMLGGGCYIGYKLDSRRHAEIRQALETRDGLTESPIIEGLTGSQAMPGVVVDPAGG